MRINVLILVGMSLFSWTACRSQHAEHSSNRTAPSRTKNQSLPFMEHPTGDFETNVAAMEDAIRRLRSLPRWDRWITFNAQGQGNRPNRIRVADIRMLGHLLDLGERPLELDRIPAEARADLASLRREGANYSISGTSPREAAKILDTLFRHHFEIRPFPEEGEDYPVGAEW